MYAVISCDECFGMGLDPKDVEALCPACRGYEVVPYAIRGGIARAVFADYEDVFATRYEAIVAITEDEDSGYR